MARLPSEAFLIQQIDGQVILFEDGTEREIVRFDPGDSDAAARAQKVIYDDGKMGPEDKCFAHFWSGYFYAHAGGGAPGALVVNLPAYSTDEEARQLELAITELMEWREANPGKDMVVMPRSELDRLNAAAAPAPKGDPCPACGEGELTPEKGKLVCYICRYVQGCCDPA